MSVELNIAAFVVGAVIAVDTTAAAIAVGAVIIAACATGTGTNSVVCTCVLAVVGICTGRTASKDENEYCCSQEW